MKIVAVVLIAVGAFAFAAVRPDAAQAQDVQSCLGQITACAAAARNAQLEVGEAVRNCRPLRNCRRECRTERRDCAAEARRDRQHCSRSCRNQFPAWRVAKRAACQTRCLADRARDGVQCLNTRRVCGRVCRAEYRSPSCVTARREAAVGVLMAIPACVSMRRCMDSSEER